MTSKQLNYLLGAIAIIAVAALAYMTLGNKTKDQTFNNQNAIVNANTIANNVDTNKNSNQTVDPTASWKTYSNSKQGYQVKYPQDWRVDSASYLYPGSDTTLFSPINAQDVHGEVIVMTKSEVDAEKTLTEDSKVRVNSREMVTIDGIQWTKLSAETKQVFLLTYKNGKTYIVHYSTFDKEDESVLTTFKFTK